jgi:hypothetical protein
MGVTKDVVQRIAEAGAASRARTALNTEYLKREIAIAEAEQREIATRLNSLRSALAALQGQFPDLRRLRLVDAAAYVIRANESAMGTREVANALVRAGVRTTYNSVATTLRGSEARGGPVCRTTRGRWTVRATPSS